jgi:hypothetical protein
MSLSGVYGRSLALIISSDIRREIDSEEVMWAIEAWGEYAPTSSMVIFPLLPQTYLLL